MSPEISTKQNIFVNTPAARRLIAAARSRRLPHAVLLIAPPYSDAPQLVRHVAEILLCSGDQPPCGQCNSCAMMSADKHPDFALLSGANKSISIQAVRDMQKRLYTASALGRNRVSLLLHADNMTPQAQNSLLKILEAPPKGVRFILTVSGEKRILPTIVSRCAVIRMEQTPIEPVHQALLGSGVEESTARFAAYASMGRMEWAWALIDNPDYAAARTQAQRALHAMLSGEPKSPVQWGALMGEVKGMEDFAFWCMASMLYDALHLRLKTGRALFNADRGEQTASYASRFTTRRLKGMIKAVMDTQDVLKRNMNTPLQMDALGVRLTELAAQGTQR